MPAVTMCAPRRHHLDRCKAVSCSRRPLGNWRGGRWGVRRDMMCAAKKKGGAGKGRPLPGSDEPEAYYEELMAAARGEIEGDEQSAEEPALLEAEYATADLSLDLAEEGDDVPLEMEFMEDMFKTRKGKPGHFEVMYIIHPDEIDSVEDIMGSLVQEMGPKGVVHRLQDMGVRQMAYAMGKGSKKTDLGNYVLMNFECTPEEMRKVSDKCVQLQKEDTLLRFMFQRLPVAVSKEWEWGEQDWGYVEAMQEHKRKARRGYIIDQNKERMERIKKRQMRRDARDAAKKESSTRLQQMQADAEAAGSAAGDIASQ